MLTKFFGISQNAVKCQESNENHEKIQKLHSNLFAGHWHAPMLLVPVNTRSHSNIPFSAGQNPRPESSVLIHLQRLGWGHMDISLDNNLASIPQLGESLRNTT